MTRKEMAAQAALECCDPHAVRQGDVNGTPFWNWESQQFMYAPAFRFTPLRGCRRYRYDCVDANGASHRFEADNPYASLAPIWGELPWGLTKLYVTALDGDGTELGPVGGRTFCRMESFPETTPPAVQSYRDCAVRAYRFAMEAPFVRSWLERGVPDPSYDLNTYPSKMIGALVPALVSFARLDPASAPEALKTAEAACDWLMAHTPAEGPMAHVPPTYDLTFCPDPEAYGVITPNWHAAQRHAGTVMTIYPAAVGRAYLMLYRAVGAKKYLDEALCIAGWYADTVQPNGSWYLVVEETTGRPCEANYVSPFCCEVVDFMDELFDETGEPRWRALSEGAVNYVMGRQLAEYAWEGQFEDTNVSASYTNLTQYGPAALACYLARHYADDPEKMALAEQLMRFVEDQFVVWTKPNPRPHSAPDDNPDYDPSRWHTPAGLEQYHWHVTIDASTANVAHGFMALYKAGRGDLWLAKGRALVDQFTVMQEPSGRIPTHWMDTDDARANFWYNCMFSACSELEEYLPFEHTEL